MFLKDVLFRPRPILVHSTFLQSFTISFPTFLLSKKQCCAFQCYFGIPFSGYNNHTVTHIRVQEFIISICINYALFTVLLPTHGVSYYTNLKSEGQECML